MKKHCAALDNFRLAAAVLVVMIHTSPLLSISEITDFWLTRIFARIAVPFFLMSSGYFLAKENWEKTNHFIRKTLILYGISIVVYLPINFYTGVLSAQDWLQRVLFDGTLYHLWYFPAVILGTLIARGLSHLGMPAALTVSALLYLIGLGGDSYYGIIARMHAFESIYDSIFAIFSYTRNGLFYAPFFLLLGSVEFKICNKIAIFGSLVSLTAMSVEGLWLHTLGVQRHDSMYFFLPILMIFLFSLLLKYNSGENKAFRRISMLLYILHPLLIVFVRACAKLFQAEVFLVKNSLFHFLLVLFLSVTFSYTLSNFPFSKLRADTRAWRELDLEALRHNVTVLRHTLPTGCALMGVVKANGYGHGAVLIARALQKFGVHAFAVACLSEGIELRKAGIFGEILILGYTAPQDAALLRHWRLTQIVVDIEHGRALAAAGQPVRIHLGLDTGMHRLGIPADDFPAISELYRYKNLRIKGVFSHLCVVDSLAADDVAFTSDQLNRFYDTISWLKKENYPTGKVHIQASYGVLNLPEQLCDYARIGIALYGVRSNDSPVLHPLDLWPVLAVRARVTSVRTLAAGESAGYERAFHAKQPTRIAAISIGYADGLPRILSEKGGFVLIHGQKCPFIGRLCMDQALVDVTALPAVSAGDIVTILGRDGNAELRAEDIATQCGTITNELLSRLGNRLITIVSPSRGIRIR